MKKGIDWFNLLTKKEQEEFKFNYEKEHRNLIKKTPNFESYLNCYFNTFVQFISSYSFIFMNTPQGLKYWQKISQRKTY